MVQQRVQESDSVRREGGLPFWMGGLYLGLHASLIGLCWTGIGWLEMLLALALLQIRGFCVSGGYHRLLAHRSYRTSRWFQFLLAAGACTALRGGPLFWAALHRRHHHHSDTAADIHRHGHNFWWIYGGWLLTGKYVNTDHASVRDLARLPELAWLNRFWLLPSLVLILGIYALLGWVGVLTVYVTSTVALLHQMALVDAANHQFGTQRYATGDESRNSMLVALLAGGEGWHNNHHHFPVSANLGFFWWEADGTWTALCVLAGLGLVWHLRTPPATVLRRNRLNDSGSTADLAPVLNPPN